jgi:hypothetical protein
MNAKAVNMNSQAKLKKLIKRAQATNRIRPEVAAKGAKPVSMREIIREIKAYRRERRRKQAEKSSNTIAKKKGKA